MRRDADSKPLIVRGFSMIACLWFAAQASATALDDARDLHRSGELDAALQAYEQFLRSPDAGAADRAAAHNNRCVILMNQGQLDSALADCRRALALREEGNDDARRARTLNNLALVLERRGDSAEATGYYTQALALNIALDNAQGQTINLMNLGVLATQSGDYAAALDYYDRAERLAAAQVQAPWSARQTLVARLNRAVVLERIGAFKDALRLLDQVRLHMADDAPDLTGDVLLNRGVVLRNLGDPNAALENYVEADAALTARGDSGALMTVQLNRAIVLIEDLDRVTQGLALLDDVASAATAAGARDVQRAAYYFQIRALLASGRAQPAGDVVELLRGTDMPTDLLWLLDDADARVAHAGDDIAGAIEHALAAVDKIEGLRTQLSGDRLRELFLAERRHIYALAVALLHERYLATNDAADAARALSVAMRAKSHALIDALGGETLTHDGNGIDALRGRLQERVLMEYFVHEDRVYAWRVSKTDLALETIAEAPEALTLAQQLNAQLAGGLAPDAAQVKSLSTHLFGPSTQPPPHAALVIAPHGALSGVPFELLIDPASARPLLDDHPLSRVPTGLLWGLREPVAAATYELVAIARPQAQMQQAGRAGHPIARALPDLPHAAREVKSIRKTLRGEQRIFANAGATEAALHSLAGTSTQVLHIASHAVLDGSLADGSVLVLGAGEGYDGLVFAHELATLDLQAQLTVLSACSTARGAADAVPPIALLSGALLAAGSRAVVATLWDVEDAATAAFMRGFYRRLAHGDAPAVAMQQTKLQLRQSKRWAAPTLWAAFVLIGDSPPLTITGPSRQPRRALTLALVLVSAATLLWLLRRRYRAVTPTR